MQNNLLCPEIRARFCLIKIVKYITSDSDWKDFKATDFYFFAKKYAIPESDFLHTLNGMKDASYDFKLFLNQMYTWTSNPLICNMIIAHYEQNIKVKFPLI